MKKLLLVLFLLIPFTVKAELKPIYDVLEEEAKEGTLAKEYTREHQDTTDGTGTDKIYHWYATNSNEATAINEKRNVLFAGFCWRIIRTTDSGGTKLLYNGVPDSNGACTSNITVLDQVTFTQIYNDVYSIGSVGYMRNNEKLYDTWENFSPTYGSYSVQGTKLNQSDYDVISNTGNAPFVFENGDWKNGPTSISYYNDGAITFKVKEDGDYFIHYYFYKDTYYDYVNIYKNDEMIIRIRNMNTREDSFPLNDLKTTDEIKVKFDFDDPSSRAKIRFSIQKPTSQAIDTRAYFGNSVEYSNGIYTLKDTIRSSGTSELSYNHYFCKDGSISCTDVYYTTSWYEPKLDSYKLSNGMTIEDYIRDQLYADDVNKDDSNLKEAIDAWFEENMLDYEEYLEDTVFCQNRNFAYETNTYNPNGGNPGGGNPKFNAYMDFSDNYDMNPESEDYLYNTNLKCENVTDRFSVSNEKAQLKYPVATINLAEYLISANSRYSSNGGALHSFESSGYPYGTYWLMSPYSMGSATYGWSASSSGSLDYLRLSSSAGIKPVVSLKKGTTYTKGDGSATNPYVIREYIYSKVETNNDSTKGTINVELEDTDSVLNYTNVKFVVTQKKGYIIESIEVLDKDNNSIPFGKAEKLNEYVFEMPDTDTTIKVVYKTDDKNYSFVKGANQTVNKDVPDKLAFGVDVEKDLLENKAEVYIDDELVDSSNYTIEDESIINFKEEYIKKLDPGKHTITLIIDGTYQLSTEFTIVENRVNPDTGNNIVKIVVIGLVALYGVIYLVQNKKRLNIIKYKSID